MAIRNLSSASISTGSKRSKFWDQSATVIKQFESIATINVGSDGSAFVEFTSIPQTYKHLQLRYNAFWTNAAEEVNISFNSDTSSGNYHRALIYANYGGYAAFSQTATNTRSIAYTRTTSTSFPTTGILDILEYNSTTKSKTTRMMVGQDFNSDGTIAIGSLLWGTSNAGISTIKIQPASGNIANKSQFALYGIKG